MNAAYRVGDAWLKVAQGLRRSSSSPAHEQQVEPFEPDLGVLDLIPPVSV